MTQQPQFSRGAARRPAPEAHDPRMQWSTGLPTTSRSIYAGWLIEVGQAEDLDAALKAAGVEQATIRHSGGAVVAHWTLPTACLFVLADGVQSSWEMRDTPERYGIAYAWRTLEDGRRQSVLKARVLLAELLAVGYAEPLTVSVKSTLTADLLAAFTRQYEVLDAAGAEQAASGKPQQELPFYAFSLPIGPGAESARGKGTLTKEITPPVAVIPAAITREYLAAHYIKREWVSAVEGRIDATIAWSMATSAAIAAGEPADAEAF